MQKKTIKEMIFQALWIIFRIFGITVGAIVLSEAGYTVALKIAAIIMILLGLPLIVHDIINFDRKMI